MMDDTKAAHELLDTLAFAKQAVLNGLAYWAGVVEELRSKLMELI